MADKLKFNVALLFMGAALSWLLILLFACVLWNAGCINVKSFSFDGVSSGFDLDRETPALGGGLAPDGECALGGDRILVDSSPPAPDDVAECDKAD